MSDKAVMIVVIGMISLLLVIIFCQQFLFQKRMQGELKKISEKLADILERDSDEKVMFFTDDPVLMDLLGQINRMLLDRQKVKIDYRKQELSSKKMLANISHDIKTPLTVILGYLEIMRIGREDDESLQKVEAKAKQVLELINAFFTLAKLEAGDMRMERTKVNLSELCRENVLGFYELLLQKEFTVDISEENASNTIIENIRGLDIGILIYNAAIEHVGYFIKVDEAYHEKQVVGNAIVPMRLCWYLCRDMARKHRGCILLCSSMAAAVGCGANAVYGAVKSFELTLAEGLWYEMRKYGVTAAGVMVGAIATPEFMRVKESLMKEKSSDKKAAKKAKKNKGQLPSEVAEYVLDHVGDGPVLFTSPGDRRMYHLMVKLPRKQSCIMMGSVMDKEFNSGYEQLDDDFTEIQ